LVPSVVSASFDTSSFIFLGFLPQKKALKTAIQNDVPSFFYESVHRFEKLLFELRDL
jgi:16S rRNA C1402 (ribose-2'-O) methylase RsmI